MGINSEPLLGRMMNFKAEMKGADPSPIHRAALPPPLLKSQAATAATWIRRGRPIAQRWSWGLQGGSSMSWGDAVMEGSVSLGEDKTTQPLPLSLPTRWGKA